MKQLALIAVAALALPALAEDVNVRGYYRQNGTYVAPSHRSAPDRNPNNNYSSQGHMNPYTGAVGTEPYRVPTYTPQPVYTPPPAYNPAPLYQPAPIRQPRPYGY